ncbi:MAG: hypothetical protein Q8L37_00850 [Candidatus Gottesmanbacteria bacterium]|nr:hypothetical protein [Candidatus Gottesmanbacteria bacterium]
MPPTVKIGLVASFLLLLTVNIVMLDLVIFSGRSVRPSEMAATTIRILPTPAPIDACSSFCETQISALRERIDALPTTNSEQRSPPQTSGSVKEYYISFGSGMTQSNVWQDIPGVEAIIDTANYPAIKSVTFEVYLKIPTANGQVYAKLYNVTDKHDVWFSEVSSEGPVLTKKEAAITLESGARTYRVMGLSTLKYDTNIQNARIRIVTY